MNMNQMINEINMTRRRRMNEDITFEAVTIDVIDSLNYTEWEYASTQTVTLEPIIQSPKALELISFQTLLIIIFCVILVVVSILIYFITKQCVKKKYSKLEIAKANDNHNNLENVNVNRNLVEIGISKQNILKLENNDGGNVPPQRQMGRVLNMDKNEVEYKDKDGDGNQDLLTIPESDNDDAASKEDDEDDDNDVVKDIVLPDTLHSSPNAEMEGMIGPYTGDSPSQNAYRYNKPNEHQGTI